MFRNILICDKFKKVAENNYILLMEQDTAGKMFLYIYSNPNIAKCAGLKYDTPFFRFKSIYSSSKEATLTAKIKSILKKCSVCKLEDGEGFDSNPVLEYLLGEGISASPAIFNLAAVHAKLCLTALRVALPEGAEQAEKLYLDALKQFFDNHQCTLVPEVFQAALNIPWKGAGALAKGRVEIIGINI